MTNLKGKIINNCYYVKEKVGEGPYTVNWYAKSLFSDFHVNLKFLKHANSTYNAGALLALKNEIYKTYNTYHAAIEKILEMDEYENHTYIATERINGTTLETYRREKSVFPPQDAVYLSIKIGRALEYVHGQNIIHKNLNPANIWLLTHFDQIQAVKLSDFAFLEFEDLIQRGGKAVGHWCMAPEVIERNRDTIDQTSDIFSLGCILYWLLTKTIPYKRKEDKFGGPTPPRPPSSLNPEIPPFLEFIVLKALRLEQIARYRSAALLCRDLIRFNTQPDSPFYGESPEPAEAESASGSTQETNQQKPAASDNVALNDSRYKHKSEDFNFFKRVLKSGKADLEYLKKQFYYLVNSRGNMLILQNPTREYLRLLDYFKDFLTYNNSLMLNFDCRSRHADYSLYYFLLASYLTYLREHDAGQKKIKQLLQKKYSLRTETLASFAPELGPLFEQKPKKKRLTAVSEMQTKFTRDFIKLLEDYCTKKNSLAIVLQNIMYIDPMSKSLLYYTDQQLPGLPVLILGILS
jgi:serine/threonine protein kinase